MASPAPIPDETLVSRMAARDEAALSALYDRYKSVVFALAFRVLRDRAEAEEALTDVFMQAWRGAAGYDAERGSVGGWLTTLARSRAIDRVRSRGRREAAAAEAAQETAATLANPIPDGVEEAIDISMKRRRIAEALGGLSQAQRGAIELAYYGGLSHSEIAQKLGEPLGTVKTRIRQGMIALRQSLTMLADRGSDAL